MPIHKKSEAKKTLRQSAHFSPLDPHGIIADQHTQPAENNHEGNISATAMGTHFAITYTDPASNTNLDWRCSSREFFKSVITSIRSGRSAMAASNHMPSTSISAFTSCYPRFINSHSAQSRSTTQQRTAPFQLVTPGITQNPETKKPPCTNARRLSGTSSPRFFYFIKFISAFWIRREIHISIAFNHLMNRSLRNPHKQSNLTLCASFQKIN